MTGVAKVDSQRVKQKTCGTFSDLSKQLCNLHEMEALEVATCQSSKPNNTHVRHARTRNHARHHHANITARTNTVNLYLHAIVFSGLPEKPPERPIPTIRPMRDAFFPSKTQQPSQTPLSITNTIQRHIYCLHNLISRSSSAIRKRLSRHVITSSLLLNMNAAFRARARL